ncbi:hypothetical protein [Sphingobacterium multivorum]|uniref:Uncharacterized protein n=1 Tax=Sphingobacterium multivorum TaxID=28454 RepID=A0A654D0E0_SPHMU|nr:hypothetical protein [Sphingobacterium multivorum]VXC99091.1 conserved hypothetical protein [Sphingobacterium multivorum]
MELKHFLDENPIINKAVFSRLMWPDNKSSNIKLAHKLSETDNKSGKQRVTEKDEQRAKEVLAGVAKSILDYIHG